MSVHALRCWRQSLTFHRADFNTDNLDEEALLGVSDTDTLIVLQNFVADATADAPMSVTTGKVNNVSAVIVEVFYNFAPGFGRFRAVFERQGRAGIARINGKKLLLVCASMERCLMTCVIQARCAGRLVVPCRLQLAP
jgi:hypothetical protein